jgi:FkbM family methyltransferase
LKPQLLPRSPLPPEFQHEIIEVRSRILVPAVPNPFPMFGRYVTFAGKKQLDWLFNEIYVDASYYFRADIDRPVILDCGSNIGLSVLFFKKLYPEARITAFEPDPATFALLCCNVAGLSNVMPHQSALSDQAGQISFFRDADSNVSDLRMSTLSSRFCGTEIKVPAVRLSDYIDGEIDLLKLDVEGGEDKVIGDLVATGKIRCIARAHIEYHHHIDTCADHLSTFLGQLEDSGFGYQINTVTYGLWPNERSFQDISLYCYRKCY